MEIAVATGTGPAAWRTEDDYTLATVIDVLAQQADRIRGR